MVIVQNQVVTNLLKSSAFFSVSLQTPAPQFPPQFWFLFGFLIHLNLTHILPVNTYIALCPFHNWPLVSPFSYFLFSNWYSLPPLSPRKTESDRYFVPGVVSEHSRHIFNVSISFLFFSEVGSAVHSCLCLRQTKNTQVSCSQVEKLLSVWPVFCFLMGETLFSDCRSLMTWMSTHFLFRPDAVWCPLQR